MASVPNINALFQNAQEEGVLSPQSLQALTVLDIGSQIQAGLGISVNNVTASEVVLVTMMIDDSGSIRFSGNSNVVREGHNSVLEALMASKQNHSILAHTSYLNGHVLFPYLPLAVVDEDEKKRTGRVTYKRNPLVENLTTSNYNPDKGTPLYDQTVVLLGRVLAKYQEFADGGVNCRTVTLIITDGADEHSSTANARTVRPLVEDLLGERHIIAAMGIYDGHTDFKKIFREMGIRDEWILTPGNNQGDIRKAFQMFSQSAVRASQGAASFSKTAAGGFGAP
ncbi:MAG: hypothetical protein K1Y36_17445 [Blastocatellia bacterium]|nr:hypothetical protein [Blastocatellia bacterium]